MVAGTVGSIGGGGVEGGLVHHWIVFRSRVAPPVARSATFQGGLAASLDIRSSLLLVKEVIEAKPSPPEGDRDGLGATSTTCAISSDDFNLGDGTVTCEASEIAKYKESTHPDGLRPFRQWLRIDPLDTFLDEDVWAVKMDVEGFELDVLRGKRSKEMVVLLKRYGFSCSEEAWHGKRWEIPDAATSS
ncbi:hypothetical protein DFJ73DRAFT_757047 [Zopfochytrium polystomum]|nr:hypothetical protein DFJ73DRAFT_757047 [Zopfochytrium polystomum]